MECEAMQCTAAATDTGANKTVCAIPKKKPKKSRKIYLKIMHGSRIQSIQSNGAICDNNYNSIKIKKDKK
jgi:hypothetical protein